jgi:hypothetical protein
MTRVDAIAEALADALAIQGWDYDDPRVHRTLARVAMWAELEHERGERAQAGDRAIASVTASTAKFATVEPPAPAPVVPAEGGGSSPSAEPHPETAPAAKAKPLPIGVTGCPHCERTFPTKQGAAIHIGRAHEAPARRDMAILAAKIDLMGPPAAPKPRPVQGANAGKPETWLCDHCGQGFDTAAKCSAHEADCFAKDAA